MTGGASQAIDEGVIPIRATLLFSLACAALAAPATAQTGGGAPPAAEAGVKPQVAPPEVVASAIAAVRQLGEQVVLGHYEVAVDRMYPQWKEKAARQAGGAEKLRGQLDAAKAQMLKQGVSMISFKPDGDPGVHEVWPGKKVETVGGQQVETLIYTKWMILIPTVTQFRILKDGQFHVIESRGFQVAISDKGKNDWTFIDGSGLKVSELRSLFLTLPDDIQLPKIERRLVEEPKK